MKFVANKIAFGRHEFFALRFGWLTKGFQAFDDSKSVFTDDDAVLWSCSGWVKIWSTLSGIGLEPLS